MTDTDCKHENFHFEDLVPDADVIEYSIYCDDCQMIAHGIRVIKPSEEDWE